MAISFKSVQKLYFPHCMDFRGRVYPIPPHLNHMGADINRGLLEFSKAKANTKYCYFYTGRNGTWIIQTKGYGRFKKYSGWHNIIHGLAHKIIRNHTAEHAILEYKLSQFVKDWGYADKHIKTKTV
jgi:hypothetical protein